MQVGQGGGGACQGLVASPDEGNKDGEQGWQPACSGGTSKHRGSAGSVHDLDRPQLRASGLYRCPGDWGHDRSRMRKEIMQ